MSDSEVMPVYEELIVSDEEVKYKKLSESLEKHVERLERLVEGFKERIAELENHVVESVTTDTSTTLPKGIQLPSQFRNGIEQKLRERYLIKLDAVSKPQGQINFEEKK